MGGSAFQGAPWRLVTPRMPRTVYLHVKNLTMASLRELYHCVASPIDGPGKKTFGDVDILVAWPKVDFISNSEAMRQIFRAIGASKMITSTMSANYAVHWPAIVYSDSPSSDSSDGQDWFVQVDIRICPSLDHLQWMLFKHSHGDIWNMFGTMIRPYGLTVDEEAMWIRIPEIEEANKKRSKVFLTADPADVLQFLGLPIEGYWDAPFERVELMFDYVTNCRMFHVATFRNPDNAPGEIPNETKALKANDRKRMSRPVYRKWIEDFRPRCRSEGRYTEERTTREAITQEACSRFQVEKIYEDRKFEFLDEKMKDFIWNSVIKGSVPKPDSSDNRAVLYRSLQLKAMKKIILEQDESYGKIVYKPASADRRWADVEHVKSFLEEHKDAIGKIAYAKHQAAWEHEKLMRDLEKMKQHERSA